MSEDVVSAPGREIPVTCFRDRDTLIRKVAERLCEAFARPVQHPFAVILSGGSTPFPAYRLVAEGRVVPSPYLYLAFTDDRHVPPDSEASNVHNARPLIAALGLPWDRVLHPRTELGVEECANDYERQWKAFLDQGGSIPLALLGLGSDGHTCSLFDDGDLNRGRDRLVVSVRRPDGRDGVSVTPALLAAVAEICFLVVGSDKRGVLQRLVRDPASVTAGRAVRDLARARAWTEPDAWPEAETVVRPA